LKLLLLIATAFLVRLAGVLATRNLGCAYDECWYLFLAVKLAAGEGFQAQAGHFWPPGYIAFVAAYLKSGLGVEGAIFSQILLSTLLVPLAFVIGREAAAEAGREDSHGVGLLAAAIIAFHPTLIAYSHYLLSETLFLPLFTAGLLLVHRYTRRPAPTVALAAGLLLGAATLIKALPLYLVPLLAIWLATTQPAGRRLVPVVLLLLGTVLVVGPWTARNAVVHQRLVLVETTTGKNLVRGNNAISPANWDWGTARPTLGVANYGGCGKEANLVDHDACLVRSGLGEIRQHPGRFVRQAGTKLADLVNPTSFLVRHIREGIYGDWPAPLAHAVVTLVALFHMALMALAVVGWTRSGGRWRQIVILLVLYMLVVHLVMFAMSRFRLPLEVPMAVGAALALLPAPGGSGGRGRGLLTAALLAVLVLCWSVRVSDLYAPRAVTPEPVERSEEK
jgi:4-amino-4-deoxy-L-arabinose transferase-like glycosyltransferase